MRFPIYAMCVFVGLPRARDHWQDVASGAHAHYVLWTLTVTYRVTMLVAANTSKCKITRKSALKMTDRAQNTKGLKSALFPNQHLGRWSLTPWTLPPFNPGKNTDCMNYRWIVLVSILMNHTKSLTMSMTQYESFSYTDCESDWHWQRHSDGGTRDGHTG